LLPAVTTNMPFWWLDNLLNLQLQWSLLALVLVLINIIYIRIFSYYCALLYTTIIMHNIMPLYLSRPLDAPITSDNQYLTIAQLNINYDNNRVKQLLPILMDSDFDLLIIQEASDEQHKSIQKLAHYFPYTFGLSPTEGTPAGMAIFSRWPITEKHLHNFGYKSGQVLEVIIQMPDATPLQLYSLHPGSPRTKELWQLRNQTLHTIAEKVVMSPFSNQIVVGDFNSSPWSSSFKQLQQTTRLKNSAEGFGYIPSWSISSKPFLSILTSAYIDHSLVSYSFQVLSKHAKKISGSDHLLLITELVI
ncbi:MAG: endonuclease/exonuclease/phosphatase family protein, partial [Alteromonadales bacterium]|nr:endonuclease/exonuclease/phosphatase family protein [Alteromonadales bacterium]